jgi:hypothetical protein
LYSSREANQLLTLLCQTSFGALRHVRDGQALEVAHVIQMHAHLDLPHTLVADAVVVMSPLMMYAKGWDVLSAVPIQPRPVHDIQGYGIPLDRPGRNVQISEHVLLDWDAVLV